jgi:lactose/L-arabinose transport system permease protein
MSKIKTAIMYIFITIVAVFSVFPFIWMVMGATNTSANVSKGIMTFGPELLNNFKKLNAQIDLLQILKNSFIISILGTVLTLIVASMAGYGFEMYRSKGREKIYNFYLLSMMVPFAAIMIPLFRVFSKLNLLNSYIAVILPTVAQVFLIFFFRQSTKSFQKELIQAARVDGLNEIQAFFYIYFPSMKSTYAAAAIISFMTNWNNFMWPLIVLQSNEKKTMTLAISALSSSYTPDYGVMMTAIIIATLPTIVLFFTMQKQFVAGMLGAVK